MSKKKTTKTTAKKAAKKAAKKTTPKKATKKTVAKKATVKKTTAKKATKNTTTKTVKKADKEAPSPRESASVAIDKETTQQILSKRTRKSTPAIFKIKSRKNTPILFTLDDVQKIIEKKKAEESEELKTPVKKAVKTVKKTITDVDQPAKKSVHGAASLTDILGFNPAASKTANPSLGDPSEVPSKWKKYYKSLIEMREHLAQGLDMHTKETLHRSSKDDSGNLSNYSQHMADAGTENFDRDFALSLVSSEQEALQEIEAAIRRIFDGTYGICEITGEAIKKERLMAVPFTRYSLEGQRQLETTKIRKHERGGTYADFGSDETLTFEEDE